MSSRISFYDGAVGSSRSGGVPEPRQDRGDAPRRFLEQSRCTGPAAPGGLGGLLGSLGSGGVGGLLGGGLSELVDRFKQAGQGEVAEFVDQQGAKPAGRTASA